MSTTQSLLIGLTITVVAVAVAVYVIHILLRDVASRNDLDPQQRWWWTWIILLGSGIGWIGYILFGRNRRGPF